MRFADEVVPRRDIEGLPRRAKPEPKALTMAKQLINGMTTDWDPERYRDTYTDELRKRIKAKEAGKEVVEADEKPKARVLDLMAALEASVDSARERRTPRKTSRKAVRKAS